MHAELSESRPLIQADALSARLDSPACIVFDCRFDLLRPEAGRQAYAQAHLPGAAYAHLDEDLSGPITAVTGRHPLPDPERFCDWLGRQGVGNDSFVVAYDDSAGAIATRLWWLLRWLGHDRVAVLDGGLPAWRAAGHPLTDALPSRRERSFKGVVRSDMTVSAEQLLPPANRLLLDVRTPERFSGAKEPIDPVAGHIPGAVNIPLQRNLDDQGRYLPAGQLAGIYRPLIADRDIDEVVCYCGSGVTACHTLLALELAGLGMARLYAGSWSEWIRDPAHEVALGG